jgi:hypothetical protein
MATMQRLSRASDRHVAERQSMLEILLRALLGLWSNFDRWDDDQVVTGSVARSVTLVTAALTRARRAERTYLGSVLADFGERVTDMPAMQDVYPRANVAPLEVYRRPVDAYIWARRNGGVIAESKEQFEQRLREIAQADMIAAERDEAARVYAAFPRITGYRRIIHPERSETGFSCGLCVVASTRVYRTADLMEIHGGCNCDTAPISDGNDPGRSLNDDDLKTIYEAAGSTSASDLLNTRVAFREHGELGPILVKEGEHWRTPEEAGRPPFSRPTPEQDRAKASASLQDLREQVAIAQERYDAMIAADPSTLDPNTQRSDERVALFMAIRNMRELATSLERRLSRT